jgi:hypothetical protein
MKKLLSIIVLLTVFSACTKDLTKYNVDPKNPVSVPSYSLFTNAQHSLANTVTSSNVNLNIFRLVEQQWEETTYTDEANYDLTTRTIPDGIWNALYRDVLGNLNQAKKLIPTDVADAGTQKNELAIIDISQVYAYYYLVTTFGNVPYSEALDITKPFPKFDDAKTVYYDLLTRLDVDIAALNASSGSFGTADVIYNGDPAAWKKFANTLKLKMGITIADFDDAKAKTVVAAAVTGGVFTSNADNAQFKYLSATPNTNPVWVDLVQSGRQDFVAASTIINLLQPTTATADPRLPYYFTTNASGAYAGAAPGASATFSLFSKPSGPLLVPGSVGSITNPDFPGLLLDYAETEFNLAEAVSRGYIATGTTPSHYLAGITASVTYWGGTPAQAATYELQTNVAYATAAGTTALQKIGVQKYLALYNRGWDAWIESRRLDVPTFVAPVDAQSGFPVRFTYPITEQNVNVINYNQASAAIGGDVVTTKLFFDKFTAPH